MPGIDRSSAPERIPNATAAANTALSAAALATSRAFVQVKKYGSAQNANTTTSNSQSMMIPRSRRNSRIRTWAVPAASADAAVDVDPPGAGAGVAPVGVSVLAPFTVVSPRSG